MIWWVFFLCIRLFHNSFLTFFRHSNRSFPKRTSWVFRGHATIRAHSQYVWEQSVRLCSHCSSPPPSSDFNKVSLAGKDVTVFPFSIDVNLITLHRFLYLAFLLFFRTDSSVIWPDAFEACNLTVLNCTQSTSVTPPPSGAAKTWWYNENWSTYGRTIHV